MASTQPRDKRLLEREQRQGAASEARAEDVSADLSDRSQPQADEEELAKLRGELEAEATARAERIRRMIEEGPPVEPKPEPIVLSEEDI